MLVAYPDQTPGIDDEFADSVAYGSRTHTEELQPASGNRTTFGEARPYKSPDIKPDDGASYARGQCLEWLGI